jgi:Transcription elongation factor, GreA/GreB, C-term
MAQAITQPNQRGTVIALGRNFGWRLHRVWSTDWFNNPQREAEKLRAIISSRLDELKQREFGYASPRRPEKLKPAQIRDGMVLPAFSEERPPPRWESPAGQAQKTVQNGCAIAVGDTVRVKYLTGDQKTLQIMISRSKSDDSHGIVHYQTPVATALLGAEEGDEVEVLVGSYVRSAIVERIIKGAATS